MALVKKKGYATIDVVLVVFRTDDLEIAIDTGNQIQVAPQMETTDAIKLIKNGKLLAQKPEVSTITNQQITFTDNIFYPIVVQMLQGGTLTTNEDGTEIYTPPLTGSGEKGKVFETDVYTAIYDEAGDITGYEMTTFPGCKGTPIEINSQDDVFRLPEYVINSYAKKGQPPYTIKIVKALPEFTDESVEPSGGGGTEQQMMSDETGIEVV